jgi:hypothetical protein
MSYKTKIYVDEQAISRKGTYWDLSGDTNFDGKTYINNVELDVSGITTGQLLIYNGVKLTPGTIEVPSASTIPYQNTTYNTVQAALDALLYVIPTITSFTNNVNILETGGIVNTIIFNWSLGKPVTGQTINNGIGIIPSGITTYTKTGLTISSNTTYTLSVTDGISSTTRSTSVTFQQKLYWGVLPSTSLTNSQILSLSSQLSSGRNTTKTFDATGGNYLYISYPTSFGVATFTVYGLVTTFQQTIISFTNSQGYTENYYIYRSLNIQNGSSITVQIT